MEKIEYKNPSDLKLHQININIYGEEQVDESFIDDIKTNGILNPIVITPSDIIISGSRRNTAAKTLKLDKVPCIIRKFNSTEEEGLALISFNKNRIKTYVQEMQEIDREKELREKLGLSISLEAMGDNKNNSKGTHFRKHFLWQEAQKGNEKAKALVEKIDKKDSKVTVSKAYKDLCEYKNQEKIKKSRQEIAELGSKIKDTEVLYLGDFTEVLDFIEDGTISAIITDPPYPHEFINVWRKLRDFATKKLVKGGWLVAYSGQYHLPEVFSLLEGDENLKYYWTMALYHPISKDSDKGVRQRIWGKDIDCSWKPILVYQKQPAVPLARGGSDYIISQKEEKTEHDWQQSESGVQKLIETFTYENDLVVDPFAGSGTTLLVAKKLNRKIIGAEINAESYNITKAKLCQ